MSPGKIKDIARRLMFIRAVLCPNPSCSPMGSMSSRNSAIVIQRCFQARYLCDPVPLGLRLPIRTRLSTVRISIDLYILEVKTLWLAANLLHGA